MDLVRIRAHLATALTGAGCRVYDHEPEAVEMPAVFVAWPKPIEYDKNYARGCRIDGEIFLVVDRVEAQYAQLRLASAVSLVDTRASIAAVIEGGDVDGIWIPPLKPLLESYDSDGAWRTLRVTEVDGLGAYDIGNTRGLGVIFRFELHTPGVVDAA